ncbi:hypothetical protein [Arthrobacter sp. CG_A4]|nr:hypothetical protein [Arthrobacter sp. CG_A4]
MSVLIGIGSFVFVAIAAWSSRLQNAVPHPASASPSSLDRAV